MSEEYEYKWNDEDNKTFIERLEKIHHIVGHEKYIGHIVKSTAQDCARWVAQTKDEKYQDQIKELEAKVRMLEGALEFYSDDNDWGLDWELVNNPSAIQDKGKVGREALEPAPITEDTEGEK